MLNYILGILSGIGLSVIAVLVGKRFGEGINRPIEHLPFEVKTRRMAEIISRKNMLDEILK
jgi:hypothetical protein